MPDSLVWIERLYDINCCVFYDLVYRTILSGHSFICNYHKGKQINQKLV